MELDPHLGHRCWFWVIAMVLATIQGVRGVLIYRDNVFQENWRRGKVDGGRHLSTPDLILAFQVPDFVLNFSCTLAGFWALALLAKVLGSIGDISQIELGTGLFLSVLVFVAVSGIAGILPWILSRTTYFGGKP